jgi:pSer/pThr/pTyr-binding forkhead associated (FHA) protein
MPKLHILSGLLEGKVIDLTEERVSVGRAMDNIIRLEDGTISHHHAVFSLEGGDYKIRDLNSTNGSRVNGLRVVESKLRNGDTLRLGSVEIRYESAVKKTGEPLPRTPAGIDQTQLGAGSAPPPTFGPASSFGRKKQNGLNLWVVGAIGLGMVVVGLLVWLVYALAKT